MKRSLTITFGIAALATIACHSDDPEFRALTPVCVDSPADAAEGWLCPQTLTVECSAVPEEIFVVPDDACSTHDLEVDQGPFGPGTHHVVIREEGSGAEICAADLVVFDETPPDFTFAGLELWPPNHKMHDVTLDDCFDEILECDPDLEIEVLWVSSDEPVNDIGDGNSEPDVEIVGPGLVRLRSERQGGGNGRVYGIGFTAVDGSGNRMEGMCPVSVPHDQSGRVAIADAEAYRVELP